MQSQQTEALPLRPRSWLRDVLLLALAYALLGAASRELTLAGYAAAVWPPAGVAFGALLLWGQRCWPGIWLGGFCLALTVTTQRGLTLDGSVPWLCSASIALGASAHALLATALTRQAFARDPDLLQAGTALRLLLLGGPCAALLGAGWATASLLAAGVLAPADGLPELLTWWIGDSLGVLIFTPLFLVFSLRSRSAWQRRGGAVAIPLLLAFAAVTAVFVLAEKQDRQRIASEFERQVDDVDARIVGQLNRYADAVAATGAFIGASQSVTRDEFAAFALPLIERLPGLQALSWNPLLDDAERTAFERQAAQLGHPDYRIRSWSDAAGWSEREQRSEYVAVLHIEPMRDNASALGVNLLSQPDRRRSVERARATGRPTATGRIALVQDGGQHAGALLVHPVLRDERFSGVAVGVFRPPEMLAPALSGSGMRWGRIHLDDRDAEGGTSRLAEFRLDGAAQPTLLDGSTDAQHTPAHRLERCLEFGARDWCLVFESEPQFVVAHRSWLTWAVLSSGLLFCGMLGLFLLILSARAEQEARRHGLVAAANAALTSEMRQRRLAEGALAQEKERAEVTLHSIGEGVITTDVEGRIEYLNPVAERILEWSSAEAAGRQLDQVLSLVHEESGEALEDPLRRCLELRRTVMLEADALLISRSGRSYAIQDSASPIVTAAGRLLGAVMVFNDVTETRRLAREARHLAMHDPLTGLLNRREFESRLERAMLSQQQSGTRHALCFIDLDRFKAVNDAAGHRAGDELLRQITRLLARRIRERDTLARLGGDEFALLLDNCPLDKACEIADGLIDTVGRLRFVWEGRHYQIGASVGIVAMSGQCDVEHLLAQADAACYAAKDSGRNRVHVFGTADDGEQQEAGEMLQAADIRRAVEGGRLCLHGQPVVALQEAGMRPLQVEVLVRLRSSSGRLLMPASFMPTAERFRLMGSVDHWVIGSAFERLDELGAGRPGCQISINLSAVTLGDEGLGDALERLMDRHAVAAERICFELPESAVVCNVPKVAALLDRLHPLGFRFTLDEFGAGLSSLASLSPLAFDYYKVAGQLCAAVCNGPRERAMLESLHELARRLGAKSIASRIESDTALAMLRQIGFDLAQGNAIARPRPILSRVAED